MADVFISLRVNGRSRDGLLIGFILTADFLRHILRATSALLFLRRLPPFVSFSIRLLCAYSSRRCF